MIVALGSVILGLVCLVFGGDWLVSGASSLAKRWGVAPIVIGLTVVAFGTSAPELVVNLMASASGNVDIAIGNVLGSNLANILLILGCAGWITPLVVKPQTTWKEIPFMFLASVLVWVLASDMRLTGLGPDVLNRIDGLVLIGFFCVFLYYTFGIAKVEGEGEEVHVSSRAKSVGQIAVGVVLLALGGWLAVDGASALALAIGMSERMIALTIVAIGTSLPELVTSITAAYRKHVDIAVGNVVGSNIFNIFWVLGTSATVRSLPFNPANAYDAGVGVLAALLLFGAMFINKRHTLERWQAALFLGMYAAYLGSLFIGIG